MGAATPTTPALVGTLPAFFPSAPLAHSDPSRFKRPGASPGLKLCPDPERTGPALQVIVHVPATGAGVVVRGVAPLPPHVGSSSACRLRIRCRPALAMS